MREVVAQLSQLPFQLRVLPDLHVKKLGAATEVTNATGTNRAVPLVV